VTAISTMKIGLVYLYELFYLYSSCIDSSQEIRLVLELNSHRKVEVVLGSWT